MALFGDKINKKSIQSFYMGNIYPAIVCFLILLGSVSGLEYYINFFVTALFVGAFLFCDSIRPIIIMLCAYVYQVSLDHSFVKITDQGIHASDFYFTGWRLAVSAFLAVSLVVSLLYFILKNKIYRKINLKTPLLLPAIILAFALIINGIFSAGWTSSGLVLGTVHAIVFSFVFFLIYHGFRDDESAEELMKYMAYLSMLIALVIVGELVNLYITSDEIFREGSIVKDRVYLGWGIWNLVGVCASMLIPMIFYGAMTSKHFILYFIVATLAYAGAVMTMSRNALLFSTFAYGACVIIGCFKGNHKKQFRIITAIGIFAVLIAAVVMFEKIKAVFGDYFSRGFDNNGRFDLWTQAWENFLSAPVFGKGFYGFGEYTLAHGPLPKMAHNTILELLSATGVFGLLAYLYYRIKTAIPVFCKPSLMKTMAAFSILIIIGGSLLDNFVFNVYPMFYYTALLAIIHRSTKKTV